jgi:hypothetical protein
VLGPGVSAGAKAARQWWLVRYLSEGTPSLRDVAKVTASLASASSRQAGGPKAESPADRGEAYPTSLRRSRG